MQCGLSASEATPVSGSSDAPSGYRELSLSRKPSVTAWPLPAKTRQTSHYQKGAQQPIPLRRAAVLRLAARWDIGGAEKAN